MSISRKENGSLVRKAGLGIVDNILNRFSNNAISNSAVTEAITEINNDLNDKVSNSDTSNTLYTITGNFEKTMSEACVLIGILQAPVNGGDRVLTVNNVVIGYAQNNGSYNNNNSIYYPLKIGDVVKLTGGNTVDNILKIYKQY